MKFSTDVRSVFQKLLIVAAGTAIGFFGWEPRLAAQTPVIKDIRVIRPDDTAISNKDMATLCTAAISALFGQPIADIKVDGVEKGLMHLSYTQPADGTFRQYKCKIEGKKIIWAMGGEAWRTDTSDGQVTFQLTKDEILLTVNFPDGSEQRSTFPR